MLPLESFLNSTFPIDTLLEVKSFTVPVWIEVVLISAEFKVTLLLKSIILFELSVQIETPFVNSEDRTQQIKKAEDMVRNYISEKYS